MASPMLSLDKQLKQVTKSAPDVCLGAGQGRSRKHRELQGSITLFGTHDGPCLKIANVACSMNRS